MDIEIQCSYYHAKTIETGIETSHKKPNPKHNANNLMKCFNEDIEFETNEFSALEHKRNTR